MVKQLVPLFAILMTLCSVNVMLGAQIHTAAAQGDVTEVERLIKADPEAVNFGDEDGATPLHHAAAKGQVAVAKLLLANKADVNARKKDGVTPLHVAAALGHKDVVELLLNAKSEIDVKDKKNRTPLSLAQANGKKEVVELLEARLAPAEVDSEASTAETVASQQDNPSNLPPTPAPAPTQVDAKTIAERFVDLVASGKYSDAVKLFDDNMKKNLPAPTLSAMWREIQARAGKFKSRSTTRTDKLNGYDMVIISCEFENAKFDAQAAFDSNQKIAGFYLVNPEGRN